MPVEISHGAYLLSDDPARLDVDAVHAYLSQSYWAEKIPRDVVVRSLANSLCIGIYTSSGAQIGLCRVISDFATFAYLCDVYVLDSHRGQGLAKVAMQLTMSHPKLAGLSRFNLVTRDAHPLYAQFGFTPVARPDRYMEKLDHAVYRRAASDASA